MSRERYLLANEKVTENCLENHITAKTTCLRSSSIKLVRLRCHYSSSNDNCSLLSFPPFNPKCFRAAAVTTRPRGVRCR
jgi:hypothetical protein